MLPLQSVSGSFASMPTVLQATFADVVEKKYRIVIYGIIWGWAGLGSILISLTVNFIQKNFGIKECFYLFDLIFIIALFWNVFILDETLTKDKRMANKIKYEKQRKTIFYQLQRQRANTIHPQPPPQPQQQQQQQQSESLINRHNYSKRNMTASYKYHFGIKDSKDENEEVDKIKAALYLSQQQKQDQLQVQSQLQQVEQQDTTMENQEKREPREAHPQQRQKRRKKSSKKHARDDEDAQPICSSVCSRLPLCCGKLWVAIQEPFLPLFHIRDNQLVFWICMISIFTALPENGIQTLIVPYLLDVLNISGDNAVTDFSSSAVVIFGISTIVCQAIILPILSRVFKFTDYTLIILSLFTILFFSLFGIYVYFNDTMLMGYIMCVIFSFAYVGSPVISGALSVRLNEKDQGLGMGVLHAIKGLSGAVAPITFATLYHVFENEYYLKTMPFVVATFLIIASFPIGCGPLKRAMKKYTKIYGNDANGNEISSSNQTGYSRVTKSSDGKLRKPTLEDDGSVYRLSMDSSVDVEVSSNINPKLSVMFWEDSAPPDSDGVGNGLNHVNRAGDGSNVVVNGNNVDGAFDDFMDRSLVSANVSNINESIFSGGGPSNMKDISRAQAEVPQGNNESL